MVPLYGWVSTVSMLQSHYKETVYFLPPRPQEVLVFIRSTSEGWKAELTLEPPSGFDCGIPGLEIRHSDYKVFALLYVRVCHDITCCGIKKISFLKVDHNFNTSLNTRNRNVMLSSSFHLFTMFGFREELNHHEISRYLVCYILFSDANVCEDLLIHICIIKASFCGIKTTVF